MDSEFFKIKRGGRNYRCQRCLNHGETNFRKGHVCKFKNCQCTECNLNNERRIINREMAVNRQTNQEKIENNRQTVIVANEEFTEFKSRNQYCLLCKNHKISVAIKGHKKLCPYTDCCCKACVDGRKHRQILAAQTKNRRAQNKFDKLKCKNDALRKLQKSIPKYVKKRSAFAPTSHGDDLNVHKVATKRSDVYDKKFFATFCQHQFPQFSRTPFGMPMYVVWRPQIFFNPPTSPLQHDMQMFPPSCATLGFGECVCSHC